MREPTAPAPVPAGHPAPRSRRSRLRAVALAALTTGALVAGLTPATATATADVTPRASTISAYDAVDPFIGTQLDPAQNKGNSAYGNTWPGATTPFGMVQSSPTTYRSSDGDQKGGYEYSADKIRGFGMTRLSGTGVEGGSGRARAGAGRLRHSWQPSPLTAPRLPPGTPPQRQARPRSAASAPCPTTARVTSPASPRTSR